MFQLCYRCTDKSDLKCKYFLSLIDNTTNKWIGRPIREWTYGRPGVPPLQTVGRRGRGARLLDDDRGGADGISRRICGTRGSGCAKPPPRSASSGSTPRTSDHVLAQVLLFLRAAEEAVPGGLRVSRPRGKAPQVRRVDHSSKSKLVTSSGSRTGTRSKRRSPTGCGRPMSSRRCSRQNSRKRNARLRRRRVARAGRKTARREVPRSACAVPMTAAAGAARRSIPVAGRRLDRRRWRGELARRPRDTPPRTSLPPPRRGFVDPMD